MKTRILLTFTAILIASNFAFSQCTPDNSITEPGYYPSEFEPVVVDVDYKQELQIRVIKDTNVIYNGFPVTATIDSINLTEIIGLPASFDYQCYNPTCSYTPDSTGCAVLEGKATMADVGTHPLELVLKIYAKVLSVPLEQGDTLSGVFALVVNRSGGVSVQQTGSIVGFYPNPSLDGVFHLKSSSFIGSDIEIYNAVGKMVRKEVLKTTDLSIADLPQGMYSYILTNKTGQQYVGRLLSSKQ